MTQWSGVLLPEANLDSVILRPMRPEDLRRVWEWRNEWRVRRFMFNRAVISWDEHAAWFANAAVDPARHLFIFEQDRRPSGFAQLSVHSCGSIADWGFYTAGGVRKGSGKRLCALVLCQAFEHLGLHKVCGQVIDYNKASLRLHDGLGFQHEGVLRDGHFDGANYYDVHCFGLLHDEYDI